MAVSLRDFSLKENDLERYDGMVVQYQSAVSEQLAADKKYNRSMQNKAILVLVVSICILGLVGCIEGIATGFPVITLLILYVPPLIVGPLIGVADKEPIGTVILNTLMMLMIPNMWLMMILTWNRERKPDTVEQRVPRKRYVDLALEKRVLAFREAQQAEQAR